MGAFATDTLEIRVSGPDSKLKAALLQVGKGLLALWANIPARIGLIIIALCLAATLVGPVFTPYSATAADLNSRLLPPSDQHWFGTDDLGRDVLARVMVGGRSTFMIVFGTVLIMVPLGLVVGVVAGFFGGVIDLILMRVTDIFLAFPRLVLALALAAALGPSLLNAVLAVALTSWPAYARVARAETLTLRSSDFITILAVMGASRPRVLLRHVTPLCVSSVLVRASIDLAGIIIVVAGLGFLGLGVQPPTPEWGAMVSDGRGFMQNQWWMSTVPGLAIIAVSLGFNLIGDGLRDMMDPRT